MRVNKNNCTQTVNGTVKEMKMVEKDAPTVIYVEYEVGGKRYVLSENVKSKNKKVKILFWTIAEIRLSILKGMGIGDTTPVRYNPSNPEEAYLVNNTGK